MTLSMRVRHGIKGLTDNNAMSEQGINAYPHQIVGQKAQYIYHDSMLLVLSLYFYPFFPE
jgi:hypothetical protein